MSKELSELLEKINNQEKRIAELEKALNVKQPLKVEKKVGALKQPQKEKRFQNVESTIGKYGLQILGVITIIFGTLFFLKYSIEHGWLSPLIRVILGLIAGTGFIAAGQIIKMRFKQWSLACIAGGLVIYYLSFYAAHNFYGIINSVTAFTAFAITSGLAIILSLWHDSLLIALFSLIGGFSAPLLIFGAKQMNVYTAVYLLILAVSFLALSFIKEWPLLSSFTFLGIIYYMQAVSKLKFEHQIIYIISIFLIFNLIPYIYSFFKKRETLFEPIILAVSGIYFFMQLYNQIVSYYLYSAPVYSTLFTVLDKFLKPLRSVYTNTVTTKVLSILFLGFGLFYVIQAIIVFIFNASKRYMLCTLIALGASLLAGLMVFQLSGTTLAVALNAYALVLFILGLLSSERFLRYLSTVFFAFALSIMILKIQLLHTPDSLMNNSINLSLGLLLIILLTAAYLAHKYKNLLSEQEKFLPEIFEATAAASVIYWLHTSVWFNPAYKFPYFIPALLALGTILAAVGFILKRRLLRYESYVVIGLSLLYFYRYYSKFMIHKNILSLNLLFIAFAVAFAAYYAIARKYKLEDNEESELARNISLTLLGSTIFFWLRSNLILFLDTHKHTYEIKNLALTIYYAITALILIISGLMYKLRYVRYTGLLLFFVSLSKLILIINKMGNTLNRIIAFMIIGALLILASFIYQKLSKDRS